MSIKRSYSSLQKFGICCLAALHIIVVTPITEILPVRKEALIPEARAQAPNQLPVIYSVNDILAIEGQGINLQNIDEGGTVIIEPHTFDPDGDSLSITYENLIKLPEETPLSVEDFINTGVWTTLYYDEGDYRATVMVDDSNGGIVTKDVYFSISDKDANAVVEISLSENTVDPDEVFDIYVDINDPEIEPSLEDILPSDYSVTYHGTAYLDAQDKKFGSTSLALDGDSDYATVPDHANWDIVDKENFTIDLWVKHTDHAGVEFYMGQWEDIYNGWMLFHNNGNGLRFQVNSGGSAIVAVGYGGEITDTDWHHVAVCKVGDDYGIYKDGEQVAYKNDSDSAIYAALLRMGQRVDNSCFFDGHIDEVRISHDNAFSASPTGGLSDTIDVPSKPHTSEGEIKLLLHLDDDSVIDPTADVLPEDLVVTYYSTAHIDDTASKMGESSVSLDGDSDYLTIPDDASWDILNQTNFTMDLWVKHTDHAGVEFYAGQWEGIYDGWMLFHNHNQGLRFQVNDNGGAILILGYGGEITDTDWHHVAVCKVGNQYGLYKDGVQMAYTNDPDSAIFNALLRIGQRVDNGYFFDGSIDELKISYDNAFGASPNSSKTDTIEVPTSPYLYSSDTKLLLHFEEPYDPEEDVMPEGREVTYHGSASIDTYEKEFGTSSVRLPDGTDYLTIPDSDDWDICKELTTDYTIDFWVKHEYASSSGFEHYLCHYQDWSNQIYFNRDDSNSLIFSVWLYPNSLIHVVSPSNTLTDTNWHHIAMCKTGNEYGIYLDGVQVAYDLSNYTVDFTAPLYIGKRPDGHNFDGNMDELRIYQGNPFSASPNSSKTDTIDVPTLAHTADASTKLLLHFDIPQGDNYYIPEILKDGVPIEDKSGIPIYIYGSDSFTKEYSISSPGVYTITAKVTETGTGLIYEASTSIEVTRASSINDVFPVAGDFNSDGIQDIGTWHKQYDMWTIATLDSTGNPIEIQEYVGIFSGDYNVNRTYPIMGDFNADGRVDIGLYNTYNGKWLFALNDEGAFNYASSFDVTGFGVINDCHPLVSDFNGDGITDIGYYDNSSPEKKFYIKLAKKDKTGFEETATSYDTDTNFNTCHAADFNGDGFSDILALYKDVGVWYVLLSTGNGFLDGEPWVSSGYGSDKEPVIRDFNHDGKTDIGYFNRDTGKWYVALSKGDIEGGAGFDIITDPVWPSKDAGWPSDSENGSIIPMSGDVNGDAIGDALAFDISQTGVLNKWIRKEHQSNLPDLLIGIDNGIGGATSIEYNRSTTLDNRGGDGDPDSEDLPFPVRVVRKVTKSDGMGNSYVTEYLYKDGYFESDSREFRGFGYVRVTDPEDHYKETYFNQGDIYKGRPAREVVYDKYSREIQEVELDWQHIQYHSQKVTFPYLDNKITTLYNYKTGDSRQLQTIHEYDQYGNVTKVTEEGFLDETGDEKETQITYEYDTAKWILSKPKTSSVIASPEGAKQSRYTYDANGSLTKEERYLDEKNKWIATDFTYDTHGNVLTVTDALGRTTTTAYEATKTFPQSVTNALSHVQSFTYDYTTGKILTSTDPNSQVTTSTYDGFGRLINVIGPGGISEVSYTYDLASNPVKITTETVIARSAEGTTKQSQYSYADGLGRTIETITEADGGQYILSGIVKYDSRGQVIEKYLPIYTSGTNYTPPSYEGKHVTYEYDPLGRVVQTMRPDNKISQSLYAITSAESINENGQRKRVTKDAYGRITKVEEYNGSNIYTTTYEYDILGNLTKTIDHAGNTTTIKYDSLGRKIDMNDPDMGYWVYLYDDVGNLTSQTDAKGQTMAFEYDEINRLKKKWGLSPQGAVPIFYTYDQNTNGVGRLSKVEDLSGTTQFFYDILGREERTVKELGTVPEGDCPSSFTIDREYDSLDRLTSVEYPDDTTITYFYNKQGGIKRVGIPGDDDYYVKSTTYNANGQLTHIDYGNNTSSDYTYDLDNLRLEQLVTEDAQLSQIQNLSYNFDGVGNLSSITDSVNSNSQDFVYDGLNRLTQATGTHYSTINYTYSPIGNMTQKGDTTMEYGVGAGPHAVTSYGGVNITYDDNGNMVTKGSTSYSFDQENRLTEVVVPKGGEVSNITIDLSSGFNYFSVPYRNVEVDSTLQPLENINIATLLSKISGKYTQVSRWNAQIQDWEHYVGDPEFDDFDNLDYGFGYEIYATEACSITFTGTHPIQDQEITLYQTQNLIAGTEDGETQWKEVSTTETYTFEALVDTTQYIYDGDGGRVKRTSLRSAEGGEAISTIYIGSSYEITIDNTTQEVLKYKKNVFMGSSRVCEVEQIGEDINAYFVHADHIGSSNIITDKTGQRASLFEYKPFGSVAYADENNSYDTDKRFNGRTYDTSAGLIFYGGRYYLPDLGRWLTADPTVQHPYDPQSLNRYSFTRNNPINAIDLNGYGFWSWIKSFFSAFVGAVAAVILAPVVGPVFSGMIGGAIAGGIAGAFEGGLSGALHGAMWGGAIGGILGAGYAGFDAIGLGTHFLVGAAIGGAVYAGVAGGSEGLANYAAGSLGAFYGASLGNALVGQSTVKQAQQKNNNNNQQKSASDLKAKQHVGKGQLQDLNDMGEAELISIEAQNGSVGRGRIVLCGGGADNFGDAAAQAFDIANNFVEDRAFFRFLGEVLALDIDVSRTVAHGHYEMLDLYVEQQTGHIVYWHRHGDTRGSVIDIQHNKLFLIPWRVQGTGRLGLHYQAL